jgi:hypothetical protein
MGPSSWLHRRFLEVKRIPVYIVYISNHRRKIGYDCLDFRLRPMGTYDFNLMVMRP